MSVFRGISRSLFAQMTLLSLVFLIVAFIYTVVLPVREYRSRWDPVDQTHMMVAGEASDALSAEYGELDDLADLDRSEIIRSAIEENPHFRLFVKKGDRTWSIGAPPKWQGVIDFDHPDLLLDNDAENPGIRSIGPMSQAEFKDEHGSGTVLFTKHDGVEVYIEISGIVNPIPQVLSFEHQFPKEVLWFQLKDDLITSLGVLLVVFLVLGLAIRSMRRVAKVAESFDPESIEHKLPESGLPAEVVPLIRAVNGMLDRVNESREQQSFFLATAAHEIRTPLAIMRARLEDIPDNVTREELVNDVRRLSRLVEDLLHLLSVRNRGAPEQDVDLVKLAKKVVEDRAPLAIDRGVDLGFDTGVKSYPMKGDDRLLRVAISNLVDNAISFSEKGSGVSVQVSGDGQVLVQDHGPGVPEEHRESIFEPFAKNPPNRKGHGLGLAIVKAIVGLHQGEISVSDTPGGGASFTIQF